MSDYRELALGKKLDALNLKIEGLQRSVADLKQGMDRIIRLLERNQEEGSQSEDPLDYQP